ncbi:MAG TPA: flagellar biosynthetic protein FliR [Verrucomicrobiae bacterium]|nr:flagellar biosynthetic protein FliR [Verrucomicrobiae bacterium]
MALTATGLLVFARCAGFAFRAPGIGHPSVTPPVRAGFAAFAALAIAPSLPANRLGGALLLVALASEFLLGGAIGVAASAIYDAAYAGGRAIDDYVGVKAIAPSVALVAPSGFGRIWSLAFTGGFFLLGAYRVVLIALARSFERIPPGVAPHGAALGAYVLAIASTIFAVALAVAAPALGLVLLVQVALGALSRAVPRFGGFTLSFPLIFAAALIATALAVPLLAQLAAHPLAALPAR